MTESTALRRFLPLLILFFTASAGADVLDEILERGTIRVGLAEFAPWTMTTASGDLIGFEVDLAKKIAADMGVKPEFRVYDWEEVIPALRQGDIDIIASGMAITPARALKVEFSRPTAESGIGLATNTAMTKTVKTFSELNDPQVIIVTVAKTHAVSVAEVLFDHANVKLYPSAELAVREVLEGRAHAYLAGMPHAKFLALKHPDEIDVPVTEPLLAQSEAVAVRKGEQGLLNFLNAWVTARQTDKWLPTTRTYWFESIDWAADATE
jgi:polar amino acid transport system substrate-binding protein